MPLPGQFSAEIYSLKSRISGGISAPNLDGPFAIEIELDDGTTVEANVTSNWISDQRAKIERKFTFIVPKHGRVILTAEKTDFQACVDRFQRNCERFRDAVTAKFLDEKAQFKQSLMEEYLPIWTTSPPAQLIRFIPNPTAAEIESYLSDFLEDLLKRAFVFEPVRCTVIYKGITYASTCDDVFIKSLTSAMLKRGVPKGQVDKLFSEFDAASTVEGG